MQHGGHLSGFSVDLWHAIERRNHFKTQWVETRSVAELLDAVKRGRADCGISAVSITSERDRQFDFSQPIYDGGLQILVRSDEVQSGGGLSASALWAMVSQPPLRTLIVLMGLSTLFMAHLLWLVERRREDGIVESSAYRRGIKKALWWSAGTLGAQADEMPRSPWGRLVAVAWMFLSIIFIAFFTATITSALTVQQLHGDINGPEDLPGKRVATVAGSTSALYLQSRKVETLRARTLEAATRALLDRKVQAVVYDAPVLQYFSANAGKNQVMMVGPLFRKQDYGIVFPTGSAERKRINTTLLTLKENGFYDALLQKYFASGEGGDNAS